jgi:hypothetical protein
MKHIPVSGQSRNALLLPASVVFLLLSLVPGSGAQDQKAFENAINYMQDDKGCLSIPYSDLEDSCERKQNEVNKLCKNSGPWNCEDVDPKETQKKIEELKKERDTLKAQREALERNKPSSTDDHAKREYEENIKKVDDKLYELKRTQGELEKEVSDSTKMVNDRMYVGKGCRDARQSVMEVYRDAKSRANGENDPNIQPLAKRLIAGWEKRESGHQDAIQAAKNGIEKCDKVLYEIGHLGSF